MRGLLTIERPVRPAIGGGVGTVKQISVNIFQEGGDGAEASSLTGNLLIVDIRNRPVLLAQKKSCCLKPGLSVRNSQGVAFLLCFLLSRLLLGLQLCALFLGQFSASCFRWGFTGRGLWDLWRCSTASRRSGRAGSLFYSAGRRNAWTSGRVFILLSRAGVNDGAAIRGIV